MSENPFPEEEELFPKDKIKKKVKKDDGENKNVVMMSAIQQIAGNEFMEEEKTQAKPQLYAFQTTSNLLFNAPMPKPKVDQKPQALEQSFDEFYKKQVAPDQFVRQTLDTYNLRKYHNWIKAVLINKYTYFLKKQYTARYSRDSKDPLAISVLDVGCGKGGDLQKWKTNKIGCYIGIDPVGPSLEEAKKRWDEIPQNEKFYADFIQLDASAPTEKFFEHIDDNLMFDIVTSQFVVHYLFKSEESARQLFKNVSARLVKDGFFIMCIPDDNVIVKRMRNKAKKTEDGYVMSNKYYSIKFDSLDFPEDKLYGIKYNFFLDECVGERFYGPDEQTIINYVPEYLIESNNFIKLAAEYGLRQKEMKNFHDFCKEHIHFERNFKLLSRIYKGDLSKIEKELWEISYLYKVVVFEKREGVTMDKINRNFGEMVKCQLYLDKDLMDEENGNHFNNSENQPRDDDNE